MSDAFRSQLEAAEEKFRRAQEELATLREEKAKLERQLSPLQKPTTIWVGAVGFIALTMAVTAIAFGIHDKRRRAALEVEALAAAEALRARDERIDKCMADLSKTQSELAHCRSPDSVPPLPRPSTGKCNCAPGDPLCACLDGSAPFDRGAAAKGLGEVDVKSCATEAGARTIHVTAVFDPSGSVSVATLDSGGDRLTESERACVTRRVREVRVPAFAGAPVRVGKSYTLKDDPLF